MYKVLVFLIVLSWHSFCSNDFLAGKARFISTDKDGLSFVKKQLLHIAFRDVISKAMKEYGLDTKVFWQNFDESLTIALDEFEKSAIEKYEEKEQKDYKDELRRRKLIVTRKFGKIESLIQSYSIKSFTRSSNNPNYRYMKIEAKVNKDNLSKFYYRYMKGSSSTLVNSLYMSIDFNNKLFNYSQIGVDKESDFTEVIKENWKDWFIKNNPSNIKNVKLIDENESEDLEALWGKDKEPLDEKYENSLYLKIEVSMKSITYNIELNKYSFEFQVSGILLDIKSKKIIRTFHEKELEKVYENIEMDKFSSIIANHIYRIPMGEFSRLISTFKDLRQTENQYNLVFRNYKNLDSLDSIVQELEKRGIKYSLDTSILSFGPDIAKYRVSLNAGLSALTNLAKELQRGKKDQVIDIVEMSKGISIKLNKKP